MHFTIEQTCKLLLLLQTMPYMPPELLAQSQLTPKADVYSFGIVMWELLSGQVSLSYTSFTLLHSSECDLEQG